MIILGGFLAAAANTFLLAFVARRLIALHISWTRIVVLGVIVGVLTAPVVTRALVTAGIDVRGHTQITPTVLISLLIVAWVVAAEVAVLILGELIAPSGSLPRPTVFVQSLPSRIRRYRRYREITRIAFGHGVGPYVRRRGVINDSDPQGSAFMARQLREALQAGGVTFVKFGQLLASRPDSVPPAFVSELSKLHSEVPPEEWSDVEATLRGQWGCPVSDVVSTIDTQPLAAASVAQVYRGVLRDGREVAIKVQRSSVRHQMRTDADIIVRVARWLERTAPWARRMDVVRTAEGFVDTLKDELDYRVELQNMLAIRQSMKFSDIECPRLKPGASASILVPEPIVEYSTSRVLVMELADGTPLSRADEVLAATAMPLRELMAKRLAGVVLRQLLVTGVFHSDLHAGNIMVGERCRLTLLDFGSVGRLDRNARTSLLAFVLAVDRQDAVSAADALVELVGRPVGLVMGDLENDLGQLIMKFSYGYISGQSGSIFTDLFGLVLRHRFVVPANIAYAFRSVGTFEGTMTRLAPELDIVEVLRTQGRAIIRSQMSMSEVRDRTLSQMAALLPVLQRLPRRIDKIAEDLETGNLTIKLSTFSDVRDRSFISNQAQQLGMVLVAVASAICGVLMIISKHSSIMLAPRLPLYTFIGFAFLLAGFILSARALGSSFRAPERLQRTRKSLRL